MWYVVVRNLFYFFFFSSRRRHTRCGRDWSQTCALPIYSIALGLGIGLALPLSMAIIADGVSLPDRGVAMGVRLTGNRLAQLVNPVFFGMVSQCWSLPAAFWWGGILLFAATGFLFFWGKTKIKRTGDFAGGKSASSKGNQ